MQTNASDGSSLSAPRRATVAIVTGGAVGPGREIARELASWGWAIVLVYLEQQRTAEATVTEIIAAEGTIVAVRADLADDLDVQRLFAESRAAFGTVDVIVHTTRTSSALLYQHAVRHLHRQGMIVSVAPADPVAPGESRQLAERDISVASASPAGVLSFLERWEQQTIC